MNPAVLKNLSYGMYVIGTKYNGRPNACVANSVIQISSSDPEKVLIALTKDTHSCTAIRENGHFYHFCTLHRYTCQRHRRTRSCQR